MGASTFAVQSSSRPGGVPSGHEYIKKVARVETCGGGPILVNGAEFIEDRDEMTMIFTRRVHVALLRLFVEQEGKPEIMVGLRKQDIAPARAMEEEIQKRVANNEEVVVRASKVFFTTVGVHAANFVDISMRPRDQIPLREISEGEGDDGTMHVPILRSPSNEFEHREPMDEPIENDGTEI